MNVFSVVERLTAGPGAAVLLDRERCLRAGDRRSTCTACDDVCPQGAIVRAAAAGVAPNLKEEACTACLACVPACPVGAFTPRDDPLPELLHSAARASTAAFELLCERHPRPTLGLAADALGLRVPGCLAGLGTGAYLALAAQGARSVVARAEACGACPWASLQPRIVEQARLAQALLAGVGAPALVAAQTEPLASPVARPIQNTQAPPLSRRDVWRQLARQGRTAIASAWPAAEGGEASARPRAPGRDRRRTNQAMALLQAPIAVQAAAPTLAGGWAMLSASDACSACGACARACPAGALRLDRDAANHFALRFIPRSCVGCEACLHVCRPAALTIDHSPSFGQVFGAAAIYTLCAGELAACQRCRAPFAARPGETLCPICERLEHNPLGFRRPAGAPAGRPRTPEPEEHGR